MKINHCKVNHIGSPLGYLLTVPRFSWQVEGAEGKKQDAARIIVTDDKEGSRVLADTGMKEDMNMLGEPVEIELRPRTRYYWTVTVRTDAGEETVSGVNWFETGKMGEPWTGKWITCDSSIERHPVFQKKFMLTEQVASARLYICGLGLYVAKLNGSRVGEERLTPYCNDYRSWIQYQTYDVTEMLCRENEMEVLLGNGWYKGRFGYTGHPGDGGYYGDSWKLIAELHVRFQDGSQEIICTDENWQISRSGLVFSGIYDGEQRDDTLPETEVETAVLVQEKEQQTLHLTERLSLPVLVQEEIQPVALLQTPSGEQVFDLGQNMAGVFRLSVCEPEGTRIRVQVGEVLQEGNFYRDNLRTAKAEYLYISDGKPHMLEPIFTYYGYRYAKVEGVTHLQKEDFTGLAYYSNIPFVGQLTVKDENLNRLLSNIQWSQKSNFVDVSTDCPQRDERMGWTADTQVFVPTACYFTDAFAFYRKYLYDLRKEQSACEGMVPNVIPSFGNRETAAVWGDAVTIIPWKLYLYYGDVGILEESIDSMAAWVEYIRQVDGGNHGWRRAFQFGDWLALDHPGGGTDQVRGGTDEAYVADVYYWNSARLVAKAAGVLISSLEKGTGASGGQDCSQVRKTDQLAHYRLLQEEYSKLADRLKEEIEAEYFTSTGRCAVATQTGYVLALYYDLAKDRRKVLGELLDLLKKTDHKLTTGFVGTPLIMEVLSSMGEEKLAYEILHNEEYPGWLYEVGLGATTIWERWNSMDPDGSVSSTGMNSFNHYAYGSVGEWMWQNMAGIRPMEEAPGFKRVLIRPVPDAGTGGVEAEYHSPMGIYRVQWEVRGADEVYLRVEVPFGCSARLELPYADQEESRELSPGVFELTYRTGGPLREVFSVDMTIGELLERPKAKALLLDFMPQLTQIPDQMKKMPLRMALERSGRGSAELDAIDGALRKL
ncbi:MAG: glycoside hydrolase family 78 protein [Butyrivibrio sp.]|nr:glycoside hydrolase family 78 protein [Butyrivibrio sp.]MCM1344422.1 glycoside hydrolase family 78 protein [Muribaculaceae bacterium]